MPIGAVIGSVVGGVAQASAAKKASKAQQAAAAEDIAFQKETRDIIRGDLNPYRAGGLNAFNALQYEMGLGDAPMIGGVAPSIETFTVPGAPAQMETRNGDSAYRRGVIQSGQGTGLGIPGIIAGIRGGAGTALGPATTRYRVNGQEFGTLEEAQAFANANMTGGTPYQGFQKSQDYLFGLNEGISAVEAGAAARGGLFSGAAMKDLNTFGQDYASTRRNEYLNRLAGLADTGLSAAQMSGNASTNAAAGVSNALAARGNAQAAGAIGMGNAINQGIGNALGSWNYMTQLRAGGAPGGMR